MNPLGISKVCMQKSKAKARADVYCNMCVHMKNAAVIIVMDKSYAYTLHYAKNMMHLAQPMHEVCITTCSL